MFFFSVLDLFSHWKFMNNLIHSKMCVYVAEHSILPFSKPGFLFFPYVRVCVDFV